MQITDEKWENQRLHEECWSVPNFDDRPHFSDIGGTKNLYIETLDLPDGDWEWYWLDNWQVSIKAGFDEDGWQYASNFKSKFEAQQSNSAVRRRKWVRTRVTELLPPETEKCLETGICSLQHSGRNVHLQCFYNCKTCNIMDHGICAICRSVCHNGHDIIFAEIQLSYCHCSEKGERCLYDLTPREKWTKVKVYTLTQANPQAPVAELREMIDEVWESMTKEGRENVIQEIDKLDFKVTKRTFSGKKRSPRIEIPFDLKDDEPLGLGFKDGGIVKEISKTTQAFQKGVKVGWEIKYVNGSRAFYSRRKLGDQISEAMLKGKFTLTFLDESRTRNSEDIFGSDMSLVEYAESDPSDFLDLDQEEKQLTSSQPELPPPTTTTSSTSTSSTSTSTAGTSSTSTSTAGTSTTSTSTSTTSSKKSSKSSASEGSEPPEQYEVFMDDKSLMFRLDHGFSIKRSSKDKKSPKLSATQRTSRTPRPTPLLVADDIGSDIDESPLDSGDVTDWIPTKKQQHGASAINMLKRGTQGVLRAISPRKGNPNTPQTRRTYFQSRQQRMKMLFDELGIPPKYLKTFEENEVTEEDFTELAKEDIESLIPAIGPRTRFNRYRQTLKNNSLPSTAEDSMREHKSTNASDLPNTFDPDSIASARLSRSQLSVISKEEIQCEFRELFITPDLITLTTTQLGRGGMGVVWLGKYLGEKVALKQIDGRFQGKVLKDFANEVRIHSKLKFSRVVQVFGITEINDVLYIVMEYCQNSSLERFITSSTGDFDIKTRLQMAIDAARGIAYLHANYVLHMDVKPQNFLLDATKRVKVTDFGLSHVVTQTHSKAREARGFTIHYAAPEVLNEESVSRTSDVYSFGILLYHLLTLKRPFYDSPKGLPPIALTVKIMEGLRPTIPASTNAEHAALMKRCWDGDPEKRPQFQEIIQQLEKFVE